MPVDPATWKAPADQAGSKEYTIKSGDTLEAIARTELGSGQKWTAIVAANPGLNPKQLKVGQKIRIPDAGGAAAAPATETMKSADTGNTYTVQKGDTLFGIARKVYGSGSDAEVRRIVDANGGTLKSKDTPLKPGMKLAIPAKR
jgi:nucleoid-associated protein YgaU